MTEPVPARGASLVATILSVVLPVGVAVALAVSGGVAEPVQVGLAPLEGVSASVLAPMASDPDVVWLGNSQGCSLVRPETLEEQATGGVAMVCPSASHAPTLYALLKNRILTREKPPRTVIIALGWAHLVSLYPGGQWEERIFEHLAAEEPELDERVFHGARPGGRWSRLRSRVGDARDVLLATWTSLPVRLAGDEDPAARMAAARQGVLGTNDGQNFAQSQASVPVLAGGPSAAAAPAQVDGSLVQAFAALAHQTRLVFVLVPNRGTAVVSQAQIDQLRTTFEAEGAAFVNLQALSVPESGWRDMGHFNEAGRKLAAPALVQALDAVNAFGEGELRPAPEAAGVPQVAVERPPQAAPRVLGIARDASACGWRVPVSAPKELADDHLANLGMRTSGPLRLTVAGRELQRAQVVNGAACTGTYTFADRGVIRISAPDPGEIKLEDLKVSYDEASVYPSMLPRGAGPDVAWLPPGAKMRLTWASDLPPGAVLRVAGVSSSDVGFVLRQASGASTAALWGRLHGLEVPVSGRELVLENPPDGGQLLLREVQLAVGALTWPVVGQDLVNLVDVQLVMSPFAAMDVTPAPGSDAEVIASGQPVPPWAIVAVDLPMPWSAYDPALIVAVAGDDVTNRCSPLVSVHEAGEPAPVRLRPDGRWAVPAPLDAGPWTVRRLADRKCFQNKWILPGDEGVLRSRVRLPVPVDRLLVKASVFPAEATVTLRVGGFTSTARGAALAEGVTVELPAPVAPGEALPDVQIGTDGIVLLARASWTGTRPEGFAEGLRP